MSNPHTLTYEVIEQRLCSPVQTIYTSQNYDDCLPIFKGLLDRDKKARIDVVLRESNGLPLFRTSIIEVEMLCKDIVSQYRDYGHYGANVYNHDYRDRPWAGYEICSAPVRLVNYACEIEQEQEDE